MTNRWLHTGIFIGMGFITPILPQLFHFPVVALAFLPTIAVGGTIAIVLGFIRKEWMDAFSFFVAWLAGSYYSLQLFLDTTYEMINKLS